MNTLGHVQYCVNVVSINNLERHEHLTIKKLWLANTLKYIYIYAMFIRSILNTSVFTTEADLRCVNWIKLLLMAQSLIWYRSPKIVTKFTRGKILSFFDIGYNVTHVLGSWARWPIAFQGRIMCKYCFCLKSRAVLALKLFKKTFILSTYFDFS